MKMCQKVNIHIYNTNQDTTATWKLNNIGNTDSWICTLENIRDLQWLTLWNFSKVRIGFEDGKIKERTFYFDSGRNRLTQVDSDRLDFWIKKENKESEDKPMLHKVTITKTEEKVLEEYYVMRGIKEYIGAYNRKEKRVILEKECTKQPTLEEIAKFLSESNADFVSVEHNYRFEPDLPFC